MHFCTEGRGASLVFQSPSLTVDVGANVTLSCDISQAFGQCSSVRWLLYRSVEGLVIYVAYGSGSMVISKRAQVDTYCLLTIPQASPSDNGTFYCLLLNSGVDYMGNGTELTVRDINVKEHVINEDHKMISEQGKEYQCSIPLAVLGGISVILMSLTVTAVYAWMKRGIIHQKKKKASEEHYQPSSETQYATLKFGAGKPEYIIHSCS
ncbi:uncharacterized protein [Hoplias malabaricus]|uniref:uncharacterized protein isoform X2 n=1 Tax=Hoplias malabaricus TaxID=27720 RepID=UPI003462B89E